MALIPVGPITVLVIYRNPVLPQTTWYNQTERAGAKRRNGELKFRGCSRKPEGMIILSEITGRILVTNLQQATELGLTKLSELFRPRYAIPRLDSVAQDISER